MRPSFVGVRLFSAVLWLRIGALVLASAAIWLWHYDRWTWASWQIPTEYSGDSLEILVRIEAASTGQAAPLSPQMMERLGAPFGANWSAYPASDQPLVWVMGMVARGIGVNATANLALLLATVSAALAFYGCARWLRWRWEWAFAMALVFAFTFQTFGRGLPHLMLVFSWTVPLALVNCALVAGSGRLELRSRLGVGCLLVAFVLGVSNPYNLFLYLQLMLWALVLQLLGPRRAGNMKVGLAALAVAVAGLCVVQAPGWLYATDTAANSPLVRNYGGTERYALKPLELFLPPSTHRVEAMAFFGHRYLRWSEWRGETFAAYLGVAGIAGLLWLAGEGLARVVRRRALPRGALPGLWVLAFASLGGVTNIVAFFTSFHLFRATNRYSIFLSAIALMFLASRLSRVSVRWPRWASVGAAFALAVIGVWEELPQRAPAETRRLAKVHLESDREFGRRIEAVLPERAMVFQLPVIAFPETQTPFRMGDYEHFRPYLATTELRFTYGALRGRARGRWQRELGEAQPVELVSKLERYGFAAIYINRRAYADDARGLLAELAALGRTEVIEDSLRQQVLVRLKPAEKRRLPIARGLTPGYGWNQPSAGANSLALPRWAWGQAAGMSYFNPFPRDTRATLRLTLSGVCEGSLGVRLNGESISTVGVALAAGEVVLRDVVLRPGVNRFDLESEAVPQRLSEGPGQLRNFAVHKTEVLLEVEAERERAPGA